MILLLLTVLATWAVIRAFDAAEVNQFFYIGTDMNKFEDSYFGLYVKPFTQLGIRLAGVVELLLPADSDDE